jgi:hypothetical protein
MKCTSDGDDEGNSFVAVENIRNKKIRGKIM